MGDLLERYKDVKKDPDIVMCLEVLKQSFQDMLSHYQVAAYSFDPETEISMDIRKKIEIVKTVKASKGANRDQKNCIIQTLHEGYLREARGKQASHLA
ncbi:MAG: hypothetical protein ACI8T1_003731 [Verrucomicrobiales bacterium]|jgi:hypothetical protein